MQANLQAELERLNQLPASEAESELLKCCGSTSWARQVTATRPFTTLDELIEKADQVWWALEPADWLEAFHSHPKIGETKAAAQTAVAAQRWSESEQSGIRDSAEPTMQALAELNRDYEEKFGFIFIVCAAGKSADEMLAILRGRMENEPDAELRIAAAEQAKITQLRIRKLLNADDVR